MNYLATFLSALCVLFGFSARAAESLVYKKAGDRELRLHIEKPADWKATDKRPAIVFYFGGGWVGGSAEQFHGQSEYFAGRGMVGIRVEYRTIPKGDKGPPLVCCADAKSAMRYVRSHAAELGVDPARIAGAGGSAGGHLAAFTGMVDGLDDPADDLKVSCRPDALVLFNPVFNNGPGQWGHERVGERFRDFSPAHNITKTAPPTCVFLGDKDKLIGVPVLREFEAGMKAAGVRCDAHVYPGAAHGFFNKEPHKSQTLAEADKFLVSLGWLSAGVSAPSPRASDVYILSGQSNMQGSGLLAELSADDLKPCANVYFWNGKSFEPLVPGQTMTSTRDGEFGPEITFARALSAKSPDRDLYLIKHYASGQPLHHGWDSAEFHEGPPAPKRRNFYPGENADDANIGQHYRTLNSAFQTALTDLRQRGVTFTVCGFAWMQGEADAKHAVSATSYAKSLAHLKRRLEQDLQVTSLPFVFGQVLPHEPAMERFTHRTEIRESQRQADESSGHPDAIPGVKMVSTDGFPLNQDTVHYTAAGLAKLGTAFAEAIINLQAKANQ